MIYNDIKPSWQEYLLNQSQQPYYQKLMTFISQEYQTQTIYPAQNHIYECFKYFEISDTKVVIIGQDPYHGPNQAHGLAFSTHDAKLPPSLKNIFKELQADLNCTNTNGDLTYLANQGVLLLNTILTVRQAKPLSHKNQGWEHLTNGIISCLNNQSNPIVFILWGNSAINLKKLIYNPIHLIIESSHPSPLGAYRSFFGSKPFSKTNEFLIKNNRQPINWSQP